MTLPREIFPLSQWGNKGMSQRRNHGTIRQSEHDAPTTVFHCVDDDGFLQNIVLCAEAKMISFGLIRTENIFIIFLRIFVVMPCFVGCLGYGCSASSFSSLSCGSHQLLQSNADSWWQMSASNIFQTFWSAFKSFNGYWSLPRISVIRPNF